MFYLSDIIALTLPGKEGRENYAAFRRAICHHPFYFFLLFGWPSLPCLFVYLLLFFFLSPVLKGDESILCFSVWEKFQQQTFYSPPSSRELRGAQLFFATGGDEARRGKRKRELARCLAAGGEGGEDVKR